MKHLFRKKSLTLLMIATFLVGGFFVFTGGVLATSTPTATVLHTGNSAGGTITYTFNEPVQLMNHEKTATTTITAEKLGIYELNNYLAHKPDVDDVFKVGTIASATLSDDGTKMIIVYTGNLEGTKEMSYVVDAWGLNITDLASNKMVSDPSQVFKIKAETPTATVSYSTINKTNKDVVATLIPSEDIIGNLTYAFTDNGSYTFKFTDLVGNIGSITAIVNNIDKVDPVITIGDYNKAQTTENIIVTAATSEGILNATSTTFTQNGSFDFVAIDEVGNISTSTVNITNIYRRSSGGGSSASVCSTVTYGDWGTCVNGSQYRNVLTQTPGYCSLTTSQQLARSRACEIVTTTPTVIVPTVTPEPIKQVLGEKKYANGTLLRSTTKIYVVLDNKLQYISSLKELAKYHGPILKVSDSVISSFAKTAVLDAKKYADGTLIKAKGDVKIYVIKDGKKVHIKSLAELRKQKGKTLTVEVSELSNY